MFRTLRYENRFVFQDANIWKFYVKSARFYLKFQFWIKVCTAGLLYFLPPRPCTFEPGSFPENFQLLRKLQVFCKTSSFQTNLRFFLSIFVTVLPKPALTTSDLSGSRGDVSLLSIKLEVWPWWPKPTESLKNWFAEDTFRSQHWGFPTPGFPSKLQVSESWEHGLRFWQNLGF